MQHTNDQQINKIILIFILCGFKYSKTEKGEQKTEIQRESLQFSEQRVFKILQLSELNYSTVLSN